VAVAELPIKAMLAGTVALLVTHMLLAVVAVLARLVQVLEALVALVALGSQ